uniref:Uncharacterized protein n=1 Tax=Timema monikensis TaxID=170555 RepID=A0A7R9HSW2_9NEOP|nr:unnamed protein product [Timema monikensis]
MTFQTFITFYLLWVATVAIVEGAKKKKKNDIPLTNDELWKEYLQKYNICKKKLNLSYNLAHNNGGTITQKLKWNQLVYDNICIVGCVMTKLGVIKNNEIDLESMEKIIKIRGIAGGEDIIKNLQVCVEKVCDNALLGIALNEFLKLQDVSFEDVSPTVIKCV